MEDKQRGYARDKVTGRFTRPAPNVDAESAFGPMGDDIPFENVSGAPSPNTIDRPRHAPVADLAHGGQQRPIGHRRPVLAHPYEASDDPRFARNAVLRSATRDSGPMDPSYALVSGFGAETPGKRQR